ncbi:MAG: alpha/beta fold hydrolase, partial [Myxococcota bacterium]
MKKWILITTLTATAGCAAASRPVASRPVASDGDGIEAYRFKADNGETVDAEWGRFSVPENRNRQDSRTLQLSFVRFRSTHPNPGPPIVYLAGGPGGSGIQTARGPRFALFMAMRAHADVIAFDQRGTGMSGREALDCQTPYALPFDQPLSRSGLASSIRQATRTCLEKHRAEGIDLDGYTTQQSAADLDALRKFLGASKLSLWAISYGTHLALATAKYHPQIVHRMILAGVEGPDHTYKMPNDQQIMLEEIAKHAATDAAVVERMPDLMASIRRLLAELASAPKTVMLADPMSAKAGPVVVGATDLQLVLAHMLGGPAAFAAMPDLVWRLEQGDWTALAVLAASSRRGQGLHGMSLAMDCASGASSSRRARIAQQAANTLLEDIINAPMPDVCEGLGLPRLSDAFRAPIRSD